MKNLGSLVAGEDWKRMKAENPILIAEILEEIGTNYDLTKKDGAKDQVFKFEASPTQPAKK